MGAGFRGFHDMAFLYHKCMPPSCIHDSILRGDHDARHPSGQSWRCGEDAPVLMPSCLWLSAIHAIYPCKWLRPYRCRSLHHTISMSLCDYARSYGTLSNLACVVRKPRLRQGLQTPAELVSTPHSSNGWEKLRTWADPISTSLVRMSSAKAEDC